MTVSRDEFLGTTQAKSDQINAADLLGGPLVCQITDIQLTGSADQPISIFVDSHPQPWKPSKTSRRVLAACWADAEPSEWVGRFVVLYNDTTVKWAGKAEGGIRTSHMSHISEKKTIMTNETRGKKAAQIVEPYYPDASSAPPRELDYYPDDKFEENLPKWVDLIGAGKKTKDQIVANVSKSFRLTQGQLSRIRAPETADEMPPQYDEPPLGEGNAFDD